MTDDRTTRTDAHRQRLAVFAQDAEDALNEYADTRQAVEEKTARLRAQRLARDAANQATTTQKANGKKPAARKTRAAASDDRPTKVSKEKPDAAPAYRFAPGQRVKIVGPAGNSKGPRGFYRIVRQLPPDQNGNCYRIRSESEPHDRVVGETQLVHTAN